MNTSYRVTFLGGPLDLVQKVVSDPAPHFEAPVYAPPRVYPVEEGPVSFARARYRLFRLPNLNPSAWEWERFIYIYVYEGTVQ